MGKSWSEASAGYLRHSVACPRCDSGGYTAGFPCPACGALVSAKLARELEFASDLAAQALERRQQIVDRIPSGAAPVAVSLPVPAALAEPARGGYVTVSGVGPAPAYVPVGPSVAPGRPSSPASSQISVQSVLAVAGAGLVAVAAVVFTFFNPDLSDFGARTAIVGGVTALFAAGAVLLARRRLTFSAEAVAALALVFLALDVWALSQIVPPGPSVWLALGAGALSGSAAVIAVAAAVRLRLWLWAGLLGAALSPAMFARAAEGPWASIAGTVAVGFAAVALSPLVIRLATRFGSPLRADRTTSTILRILVLCSALVQTLVVLVDGSRSERVIGALVLLTLALLTASSAWWRRARWKGARPTGARFWAFSTGALVVAGVVLVTTASPLTPPALVAALPAAGSAVAALVSVLTAPRSGVGLSAAALRRGAWSVAMATTLPAALIAVAQLVMLVDRQVPREAGLAAVLGALAFTTGSCAACARVPDTFARGVRGAGLWCGAVAILSFLSWPALPPVVQVALAVAVAVASSGALVALRRRPVSGGDARPSVLRAPLTVLAHAALVVAAIVGWSAEPITVVCGAAVVAAVLPVALTVPARYRPAHVAAGFGFALLVVAHGLTLTGLDVVPLLCLLTSLASGCALAATLLRRIPTGHWYAVLGVTAVPFLLGIVSVVLVRSAWTAFSTAVTFALALTLVLTTRPGLDRRVRAVAAAILVPALAVIVICLGAEVLAVSASPVTLPVIALIVAAALPATRPLAVRLGRRVSPDAARLAVLFVELSAYLTGALAVLLALVRSAAGLGTTALVLVLLGTGAAIAGGLGRRRLPWVVAGTSWTGALWSVWGLLGIAVPETYLVPPAAAAVVVGLVLTRRGREGGWWFYALGSTLGVLPTLALLALVGPASAGSGLPWRTAGLALVSVALLVVARSGRLPGGGRLRNASLVLALFAATGSAVQAVRIGWGLDAVPFAAATDDRIRLLDAAMGPVLVLTAIATVLCLFGGRQLAFSPSGDTAGSAEAHESVGASAPQGLTRAGAARWCFIPAALVAVAGPVSAADGGWFAIVTLWLLTLVLLGVLLAVVARARVRAVAAPPVWLLFLLAWCTAVAGWSARELRVEVFSLPLGLAVISAGVLAMRSTALPVRRSLTAWPVGFTGSWWLLAPGIVATLLPSILATGTDPLTWRAILVIALALAAILLGSRLKLAAPFILGILVLPIENAVVFFVQIGRSIGAAPWWMTLATAGAVLLLIAVTSERRSGTARGVGARLRDLA